MLNTYVHINIESASGGLLYEEQTVLLVWTRSVSAYVSL